VRFARSQGLSLDDFDETIRQSEGQAQHLSDDTMGSLVNLTIYSIFTQAGSSSTTH